VKSLQSLRNREDAKSAKCVAKNNSNVLLCVVFATLRLCVFFVRSSRHHHVIVGCVGKPREGEPATALPWARPGVWPYCLYSASCSFFILFQFLRNSFSSALVRIRNGTSIALFSNITTR